VRVTTEAKRSPVRNSAAAEGYIIPKGDRGMKRKAIVIGLVVLGLASATTVCGDKIRMVDGRVTENVEVLEETYETVTYKIGGVKQEESAADVLEVIHEDPPIAYRSAQSAEDKGEYIRAAGEYENAAKGRGGLWIGQYGYFRAGECYRKAGDPKSAAEAYKNLLKAHPKTIHYGPAKLGLGRTLAALGSYDEARSAFSELEKEAKAKDLGEQYVFAARLELARTFEIQERKPEAAKIYRKLALEAKRKHPEVGFAARLGELRTTGGRRAAEELAKLIDNTSTPSSVRAGAYVLIGRLQQEAGNHKQALLSFLRVCFDPPLAGFPEERAEGLYRAAEALEKVKTQDWRERAEALRSELRSRYPNTKWAQQL
ncbi:tol-pal system YbgF family protein, partial [Planctomycetota bacterium]